MGESRVHLPALGVGQTARLWVSYQRYAFLLLGVPVALFALAVARAPWWVALIVGVIGLAPARFGVEVWSRWPRKLRATRLALARVRAGRFEARSIRTYCGDPCFRVVARELLAQAGVPRDERRALVKQFSGELRRERDMVVLVDHVHGTVITLGGDPRERT